ncbi:MAG: hypothetical protein M3453_18550, partial [Pseudomonadota bacterium]|nr:hypothetical protein [Pseudomonadota bacterium]
MKRFLAAVAIGAIGMASWSAADALTFDVRNTEDSGAGSLRQAVLDANAAAGPDAIGFDAGLDGQAIVLTSGPLEIGDSLDISGPGPDKLVIRS